MTVFFFFRGQWRISEADFQSVFETCVLRKKIINKEELQLLQLAVEPETLLLVQIMCSEDSVHVTRTLLYVHWIWSPRSLCARAVQLWRNIIDRLLSKHNGIFLSCISGYHFWLPLSAADHCLAENGLLRYS